jgi:hypothetical protein
MSSVGVAQKSMTLTDIKAKAKVLGVEPGKKKKAELIHAIQVAEGCTPCYGRAHGNCPWTQCCWRTDCFKVNA